MPNQPVDQGEKSDYRSRSKVDDFHSKSDFFHTTLFYCYNFILSLHNNNMKINSQNIRRFFFLSLNPRYRIKRADSIYNVVVNKGTFYIGPVKQKVKKIFWQ